MTLREYNFDGLVGPTHGYAGLSAGNLASARHAGRPGNPREAALQGLEKMRRVAELGAGQGLLLPQPRPDTAVLARLGFGNDPVRALAAVQASAPRLLQAVSSASAMWAANAATAAPSCDTTDGRVHLTVANLSSLFHRSLEAETTSKVFRAVFGDTGRFDVHDAVPPGFGDEGAANHTRLVAGDQVVHLFAWGRSRLNESPAHPRRFVARQTLEASQSVARLNHLRLDQAIFWQQSPHGIDAGSFHTDVLAVGNESFLMLHEMAFVEHEELLQRLRNKLGDGLSICLATPAELPVKDAVNSYPFNSQVLSIRDDKMVILAPEEARENPRARAFLERVVDEDNPIEALHYIDVNASMLNGGGPACLRLRVPLTDTEAAALTGRVLFNAELYDDLVAWVKRCYRDRLVAADLADPQLLFEVHEALDALTQILQVGAIYDFQRS